uniref:Uncharacterized protein n=1 Tax=Tanacetum cinerariifolium TaxID=118510 RepID=A0A6L2L8Y2_TANCI|nr:hypothetical protein [Tanacetum cinerariifolium]
MNDDTSMCERHEENYIQSEGYQNQNSHDSCSHQSHHDPNDSKKSLTELNNDVKNDLKDFKRCVRSLRTVHDRLFDRDDQAKTNLEKLITKFLDCQRVASMYIKNNVNDTIIKMKQNEKSFQGHKIKNKDIKLDEWSKSQNVSLEQTDGTAPPPPQAQTEQVNVVFTESGKSKDSLRIQKDPPPPIIVAVLVSLAVNDLEDCWVTFSCSFFIGFWVRLWPVESWCMCSYLRTFVFVFVSMLRCIRVCALAFVFAFDFEDVRLPHICFTVGSKRYAYLILVALLDWREDPEEEPIEEEPLEEPKDEGLRWGSKSSWGESSTANYRITCDNTNRNTMLSEAHGMSLRMTIGVRIPFKLEGEAIEPERRDNRWDIKSFGYKLPDNIHYNPLFQRLGRHPTSVHVFHDPILFMVGLKPLWEHEMVFRNFIYADTDKDLSFLSEEPLTDFGTSSPYVSINTEPPIGDVNPWYNMFRTRPIRGLFASKGICNPSWEYSWSSSSRATSAKTTSLKDAPPLLTISDDDEGLPDVLELQNINACHLKIAAITPPAWKNHLDNHLDIREECDVMKERKRARDEAYEGHKAKCEAAMMDFDNNPALVVLPEKISTLPSEAKEHKANLDRMMLESKKWAGYQEVDDVKRDRIEVVLKVVPYIAMELVHRDELGRLVGKLVSFTIIYERCVAFEEVAEMKEPFYLMNVKGYRPSYKKEHTKAGNNLATATFSFLSEVVVDPSA